MKCQQKCDNAAVTVYNEMPVCAVHWNELSLADDEAQAEREGFLGDGEEIEDPTEEEADESDDSMAIEEEF